MKKVISILLAAVLMAGGTAGSASAAEKGMVLAEFYLSEDGSESAQSDLLPEGVTSAETAEHPAPRSMFYDSANVSISNEGGGKVGVYADVVTHVPVEEIMMDIFLEVWNEDTEEWDYVTDDFFDEVDEDWPNGNLHDLTRSYYITNVPTGYYYRLFGAFAIYYDGFAEAYSAWTDGIQITKYIG